MGAVLKAAITESGYKQIDVAARTGIHPVTLSEMVNGRRKLELGDIVTIAQAIKQDPRALVKWMLDRHLP